MAHQYGLNTAADGHFHLTFLLQTKTLGREDMAGTTNYAKCLKLQFTVGMHTNFELISLRGNAIKNERH